METFKAILERDAGHSDRHGSVAIMLQTNGTRVKETEHDWVRAHAALSRLARERAAADAEEGRWLLVAFRSAAHVHLGFGSFVEYVGRLFGYKPRSIQEKLCVAEALEELPLLGQALDSGSLGWSAVRELTRVAVADTEREWLDVAQGKTVRQLEELVACKEPGDEPSAPSRPEARRHVLRFDVAPETLALVREAIGWLRRRSPDSLDDDAALLSMARLVLGEHRDDGRASYQISLTVCAACGTGQQQAGGELVPVGANIVEMAHCDGQHLGHIAPLAPLAANENAVPATVQPRESHCAIASSPSCAICTANSRQADCAHVGVSTHCADAGGTDGETNARAPRRDTYVPIRATQPVPPALRRAVLLRDQHCCRVPGCKNTAYLDLHHIDLRSEGGRNVIWNILTLCGTHHRATHQGTLLIERDASGGACFFHGDGTPYGHALEPQALDVQAKLFSALRNMSFTESEVRAVLAELRRDDGVRGASIQDLLREALRRIRPPRPRTART